MKLYEIDAAIEALIDPETGEVADCESFMALQMAREQKCENIALLYKNTLADVAALKAEETTLAARRKAAEATAARLKEYLDIALGGEKFETPRVKVGYRKSTTVVIDDEQELIYWAKWTGSTVYVREKPPEINKDAVKEALRGGCDIPGARLVEKNNIQIK